MFDRIPVNEHKSTDQANWLGDNLLTPATNALKTAANAGANIVNYALPNTLGKLEIQAQTKSSLLSSEWLAQTISATAASILTYSAYGKAAGAGLRAIGAFAGAEGKFAGLLASKAAAQITGAAILDGSRDVHEGESRAGNLLGGATVFAGFALANKALRPLTGELSVAAKEAGAYSLASLKYGGAKTAVEFGAGSSAALSSMFVADMTTHGLTHRELSNFKIDGERALQAIITGGLMNAGLNARVGNRTVQEHITRPLDKVEQIISGRTPLQDFVREHNLNRREDGSIRSQALEVHSRDLPLTSVRLNSSAGGKNTIGIDKQSMDGLKHNTGPELERARDEVASLIGNRLAGKLATRHGYLPGVLDSTGIRDAINDGRIVIKVEGKQLNSANVREYIGANNLDIHLDGEFIVPPKGQHIVLDGSTSAKKVLADWGQHAYKADSIQVEPNGTLLAFTKEQLGLIAGPQADWNGRLPVKAAINSKSSVARMFVETHQTAPQVNLGTDNRIVLEIKNNSGNTIELRKGTQIGSLVFYTLTGHGEQAAGSYFNGQSQITGAKGALDSSEGIRSAVSSRNDVLPSPTPKADITPRRAEISIDAEKSARIASSTPSEITLAEALLRPSMLTMDPKNLARLHNTDISRGSTSPRGDNPAGQQSLAPQTPSRIDHAELYQPIPASDPRSRIPSGTGANTVTPENWRRIHD